MLQNCVQNRIPFRYVLNDIWFASAENMRYIKDELGKEFIMGLKSNRKIALSRQEKQQGSLSQIGATRPARRHSDGPFTWSRCPSPFICSRQRCTNADGSTAVRYLVTSDSSLTANPTAHNLPETVESGRVSSLAQTERMRGQITDPHTNDPDQSLCGCSLDLYQAGDAEDAHQEEPLCTQDALISLGFATGFPGIISARTSAS